MLPIPKLSTITTDAFKNLGIDPQVLNVVPVALTDIESARKLGITVRDLNLPVVLSPNKPLSGKNFLSFFAPMMLLADPRDSNNIALFSSAFPAAVNPAVQVEFYPLKPGKKHLVEFNITINQTSKVYKFRVIQYPTGTFQDIAISSSQVINVIIDTSADATYSYGATMNQQNTVAEACGWMLHSVKISSIN